MKVETIINKGNKFPPQISAKKKALQIISQQNPRPLLQELF